MLICPKCEIEYREGFSVCSECGAQLIERLEEIRENKNDGKINDLNWLKEFGSITAQRAITILFYAGTIPLFISAIMFGKYIYLTNKYFKDITYMKDGTQWYTQTAVNNLPLGIFLSSIYFVFGILIWKIICELLIIIFRCLETYIRKNND